MGFKFNRATSKEEPMGKIIAAKDLYADADGNVIAQGPKAATLVAREGRPVPPQFEKGVTAKGHPKAAPNAKAKKPAGNKAKKGSENK